MHPWNLYRYTDISQKLLLLHKDEHFENVYIICLCQSFFSSSPGFSGAVQDSLHIIQMEFNVNVDKSKIKHVPFKAQNQCMKPVSLYCLNN